MNKQEQEVIDAFMILQERYGDKSKGSKKTSSDAGAGFEKTYPNIVRRVKSAPRVSVAISASVLLGVIAFVWTWCATVLFPDNGVLFVAVIVALPSGLVSGLLTEMPQGMEELVGIFGQVVIAIALQVMTIYITLSLLGATDFRPAYIALWASGITYSMTYRKLTTLPNSVDDDGKHTSNN